MVERLACHRFSGSTMRSSSAVPKSGRAFVLMATSKLAWLSLHAMPGSP